jgi:hypothetical protein
MKKTLLTTIILVYFLFTNLSFGQSNWYDWSEKFNEFSLTGWRVKNNSWPRVQQPDQWAFGPSRLDAPVGNHYGPTNDLLAPQAQYAFVGYSPLDYDGATISKWFFSPIVFVKNGDVIKFRTRSTPDDDLGNVLKLLAFDLADWGCNRPNRLEVRLNPRYGIGYPTDSINVGTGPNDVGHFDNLILTINSALTLEGYTQEWTEFTATVSGLPERELVGTRIAFRYYVTNGGYNNCQSRLNLPLVGDSILDFLSLMPGPVGEYIGYLTTAVKLFDQLFVPQVGKNGTYIAIDDIEKKSGHERFLLDNTKDNEKRRILAHHTGNISNQSTALMGYNGNLNCSTNTKTIERFYEFENLKNEAITITPILEPLYGAPTGIAYLDYETENTTIAAFSSLPITVKLNDGVNQGIHFYRFKIEDQSNNVLASVVIRIEISGDARPICKGITNRKEFTIPSDQTSITIDPTLLDDGSSKFCGGTDGLTYGLTPAWGSPYPDNTLRCNQLGDQNVILMVTDNTISATELSSKTSYCYAAIKVLTTPNLQDNYVQNYYLKTGANYNSHEGSMRMDSLRKPPILNGCSNSTITLISITNNFNQNIPIGQSIGVGTFSLYWKATNASGLERYVTSTLNVIDNINPFVLCPNTRTIPFTQTIPGVSGHFSKVSIVGKDLDYLSDDNTRTSNDRGLNLNATQLSSPWYNGGEWVSEIPFNCGDAGETFEVYLKAFDKSGNSATCVYPTIVTIGNPSNPICKNIEIPLNTWFSIPQAYVFPDDILEGGSTAQCGASNFSLSKSIFYCDDINVTTPVTVSYYDNYNIQRSCVGSVKILPMFVNMTACKDTIFASVPGTDSGSAMVRDSAIVKSPCGTYLTTHLTSSGATNIDMNITGDLQRWFNVGISDVQRTTMVNNEPVTCSQKIIVIDDTPPAIIDFPEDELFQLPSLSCTLEHEIVNNFWQGGYDYWMFTVTGATDTTAKFRKNYYLDAHWLNKIVHLYPGVNNISVQAYDEYGNMSEINYTVEIQIESEQAPFAYSSELDNQSVYVQPFCDSIYMFPIESALAVPCKQTGYMWYYEVRDGYMGNILYELDSIHQDSGAVLPIKVGPEVGESYNRTIHFGYHNKLYGHKVYTTNQQVRLSDTKNTISCPSDTIIYNSEGTTLTYDYTLRPPISNCEGSYWGYTVNGVTSLKTVDQNIDYNSAQRARLNGTDVSGAYPVLPTNSNATLTLNNGLNFIQYSLLETSGNITTPIYSGCRTRINIIDDSEPVLTCPENDTIHRTSDASCFVNVLQNCQQVSGFVGNNSTSKIRISQGNSYVLVNHDDMPNSVSFVSTQLGLSYNDKVIVLRANCSGTISFNWEYQSNYPQFFRPFVFKENYSPFVYSKGLLGTFNQGSTGVQTGTISQSVQAGDSIVIGVAEGGTSIGYFKISNLSTPQAALIAELDQVSFTPHPSLSYLTNWKSEYGIGDHNITYRLTNLNNNSSVTCNQTLTVIDDFALSLACSDKTVYLNNQGRYILSPSEVVNTCFPISATTLSMDTVTCSDIGTHLVTVSSTDQNNNVLTCDFNLTVIDTIKPKLISSFQEVNLNTSNVANLTSQDIENMVRDNCGLASVSASKTSFTCADIGTQSLTITAEDVNGNIATLNFSVFVKPIGMNFNEEDKNHDVCQNESLTLASPSGIVNSFNYQWQEKEKNHALLPWNYFTSDEYTSPVKNATSYNFDRTKTIGMSYNNGTFMAHNLNNDSIIRFKKLDPVTQTWINAGITDYEREHSSGGTNGAFFTGHFPSNGNSRYLVHLNHLGKPQVLGYNEITKSWVMQSDVLPIDHNKLFFNDDYFFPVRYDGIVRAGKAHSGGATYVWELYKGANPSYDIYVRNAKNIVGIRSNTLNQNMFFKMNVNELGYLDSTKDSLTVDPTDNSNLFAMHSLNDEAYIAYKASNGKACVKKYNGNDSWSDFGLDVSDNSVTDIDLSSYNDTLYLLTRHSSNEIHVKKHDGTNWISLVSPNENYNLNFASVPKFIDVTGKPQFKINNSGGFGILSLEGWKNIPSGLSRLYNPETSVASDKTYRCLAYKFECVASYSGEKRVIVHEYPSITVTDTTVLNSGSTTLQANATVGNVIWSQNSDGSNELLTGSSFTTGLLYHTTSYFVHANNNGCNSDTVESTVFVNDIEFYDYNNVYQDATCYDDWIRIGLDTTIYGHQYYLYEKNENGIFELNEDYDYAMEEAEFWISPTQKTTYKIKVEEAGLDAAQIYPSQYGNTYFEMDPIDLAIENELTVEMWVFVSSIDPIYSLGHTYSSNNASYYSTSSSQRNWEWHNRKFIVHNGNTSRELTFPNFSSSGRWIHVATSAGPDGLEIYYDGVLVASNNLTSNENINSNNYKMTILRSLDGQNAYSMYGLDEFRVWNTKRSASDVANNIDNCIDAQDSRLLIYNNFSNYNLSTKTYPSIKGNGIKHLNPHESTDPQQKRGDLCGDNLLSAKFLPEFTIDVLNGQNVILDLENFYSDEYSCGGELVPLSASVSGGDVSWYSAETGGELIAQGNNISVFFDKDTIIYAQPESVCSRWGMSIDVFGNPEITNVIHDTICADQAMNKINFQVSYNNETDGFEIFDVPTGGSPINRYSSSYKFNQDDTLYIEAYNSYCVASERVPFYVHIYKDVFETLSSDTTICGASSINLYASADSNIWDIEWYDINDNFLSAGNEYQTPMISENVRIDAWAYHNESGCWFGPGMINVTVNPFKIQRDSILSCEPITWVNGETYTQSVSEVILTRPQTEGCDSVYYLNLQVSDLQNRYADVQATGVCVNQPAVFTVYASQNGKYYALVDVNTEDTLTKVVGNGSNIQLTTAGLTANTSIKVVALDSLVNLHEVLVCEKNLGQFTINVGEFMTQSTAITCGSYTWRGETYSASGTYYDTLSSIFGCDSILRLNLTINAPYNDVQNVTACESYTWNGTTYTSSQQIIRQLGFTRFGCDSIQTLNLTIGTPNSETATISACDSYTWIDGVTYTASNNTATHVLTNTAGCDSTVTLNLTINNSNTGIATITACGSYTWIDGVTYTASNNSATHVLTNQFGCDSTVTLNLTIQNNAAPTNLVSSNISLSSVDVSWTHTGGQNMIVQYRKLGNTLWQESTVAYADNFTIIPHTGQFLLATDYEWRVRVSCNGVYGAFSSIEVFTTPCRTATNLTATNISLSSATLSWTHPGGDEMLVQYRKLGNTAWQENTVAYASSYVLIPHTGQFNLVTEYQWRVRVKCGADWGAFSTISTFITPCQTPTNLIASNVTVNGANLSWTHPGGDEMIIQYRKLGNTAWQENTVPYASSYELTSHTGQFLVATDYEWRIRVKCGADWGAFSSIAQFSTPCKTPINLNATNISVNDATITFIHPGGDNMLIEYRKQGNTKWQTTGEIAFANSHVLVPANQFGLNTTFEYRVRVKCGADWGSYSVIETFTTPSSSAMIVQNSSNEYSVIAERTATSLETYPNPNKGNFTISSSHEGTFNIINELGQMIQRVEITKENNFKTKVEGLAKGVYFVTGIVEDKVLTQKVVVQ